MFDFVKTQHADVSVVGRSLGSGVAVFLAAVRNVNKLVLVTPYDSIENIAKKQFPMFPVALLLKDKFASASRAANIKIPTLVIIAEGDEVIPRANSDALVAVLPKTLTSVVVLPGITHNTVDGSDEYARRLLAFL